MNARPTHLTQHQVVKLLEENETLRETIRQLQSALVAEDLLPAEWLLTKNEQDFFRAILKASPAVLTYERMMHAVYGLRHDDWPGLKIIHVVVCRIRHKLRAHGVPFEIETVWGRGYRLNATNAALARECIERDRTPLPWPDDKPLQIDAA